MHIYITLIQIVGYEFCLDYFTINIYEKIG